MSTTQKPNRRSRLPRIFVALFLSLLSLLLILWAASGPVAKYFLGDFFAQNGAELSENTSISYNPFLTRLTIENLEVVKSGIHPLRVGKLIVELRLSDLLNKTVSITELSIHDFTLDTQLTDEYIETAGIRIDNTPSETPAEPAEDSGPFDWTIIIPRFLVSDATFNVKTKGRSDTVKIDVLDLADFQFDNENLLSELLLRSSINATPTKFLVSAQIENPLDNDHREINVEGSYNIQQLVLEQYTSFLPKDVQTLLGKVSNATEFQLDVADDTLSLGLSNFEILLNESKVKAPQAEFSALKTALTLPSLDLQIDGLSSKQPRLFLNTRPALTINGMGLSLPNPDNSESKKKTWIESQAINLVSGDINLESKPSEHNPEQSELSLTVDQSQLSLSGINAQATPVILSSANQTLGFSSLQLNQSETGLSISITPSYSSGETTIYLHNDQNMAASWGKITLPEGWVKMEESPSLEFPAFTIEKLQLSNPRREDISRPLATLDAFSIANITFADNHLAINTIGAEKLDAEIILTAKRVLHNLIMIEDKQDAQIAQADTTKPETAEVALAEEATPPANPVTFTVNQISISPQSHLKFVDRLMTPWYEYQLDIEEYTVGPIDSRNPDQKTNVVLKARSGEYTKYEISGFTQPLKEKVNLALAGELKEVPLPPQSFYLKKSLGYEIESGELDTKFDVKIVDNKIKGKSNIKMRTMELIPAENVDKTNIDAGAISLNAAMSMLKDGDGTVDVDVPLDGDLEDPKFGLGGFISIIMKQALTEAAKTYLIKTMVPYANIVSVAMIAGDQAFKLRFAPLNYQATVIEVAEDQKPYLEQFKAVMDKNKQQIVRLCAVTTPQDIGVDLPKDRNLNETQKNQLIDIGYQRERALKKYLVEKGIASSRLLECKPKIERGKDAVPHIELDT